MVRNDAKALGNITDNYLIFWLYLKQVLAGKLIYL